MSKYALSEDLIGDIANLRDTLKLMVGLRQHITVYEGEALVLFTRILEEVLPDCGRDLPQDVIDAMKEVRRMSGDE